MIPIRYCYGRRDTDNYPTLQQASDFSAFTAEILRLPRAKTRGERTYICGPMKPNGGRNGCGHRCKADLLPRAWLALDLDGGSREDCDVVLLRLSDYLGVAWTTARSIPECPRVRILMALTRAVDGGEGERLGPALAGMVGAGLASLHWDPSTYKGEQECFLPMVGADVMRYEGEPVDVDAVLALAPVADVRPRPAVGPDPYRAAIIEQGLLLRELGPGKDAVACPNAEGHSEATSDTSTVYFWPLHGGYKWGGIHCLHAHCADWNKDQRRYMEKLGLDPRSVWREQDRGAKPAGMEPRIEAVVVEEDPEAPWPAPLDGVAYHGLAGEIVRLILPQSESDPAALLMQTLVAAGTLFGHGAWYQVEATKHHPNLFLLVIGETGKGRKGTSWDRVLSIFSRVMEWPVVTTGLSSGEGFKYQVRDARPEPKRKKKMRHYQDPDYEDEDNEAFAGVTDKRLLVVEPEFAAQVLRVMGRQGSTLSGSLRQVWETGNLNVCTRRDPIKATGAHISVIGHCTPEELRKELSETEMANGLGNRFLVCCARRSKQLPHGGEDLDEKVMDDIARRLALAGGIAGTVGRIRMTGAARGLWESVYPVLTEPKGDPLVRAMTGRAEAQAVRWGTVYALLDGRREIDVAHLEAAIAVVEFGDRCVRYVWSDGGRRQNPIVASQRMRDLRGWLRDAGETGLTTKGIRDMFQRNVGAGELQGMLSSLVRAGFATSATEKTEGVKGRPPTWWRWRGSI